MIFLLEGEITIHFHQLNEEINQSLSSNLLTTLSMNHLTVISDEEEIDIFNTKRKYKMYLKTSSRKNEMIKFIAITPSNLNTLLNLPNFYDLKAFLQTR